MPALPATCPGQPHDGAPFSTPLCLVVFGDVGAGKTTLLNRLLPGNQATAGRAEGELATAQRRFVVAHDVAWQAQCTSALVEPQSPASAALWVVDASQEAVAQTHFFAHVSALLGVRHAVLLVNKMDAVGFDRAVFEALVADHLAAAAAAGWVGVQAIPVAGLGGDNLLQHSAHMPWYTGPSLLAWLDGLTLDENPAPPPHETPHEPADQFVARVLWMHAQSLVPGRQYLLRSSAAEMTATVTEIKHREDVATGARLAAKTVGQNEFALVNLSTSMALAPGCNGAQQRRFVLWDALGHEVVGVGRVEFSLRRASNIHWQALGLDKATRALQKGQTPRCIWFTGLSGSGKSTLASLLEQRLFALGKHTYLLDGDNVRHGLNRDLGFTEADRVENIRRVAEVAKLMVDAGLVVLVSFISPFRSERRMARDLFAEGEFVEVYVDTPLAACEQRDVKGLYAKARRGELKNFTGIDSPYEPPEAPQVHVRTTENSPEVCVEQIIKALG